MGLEEVVHILCDAGAAGPVFADALPEGEQEVRAVLMLEQQIDLVNIDPGNELLLKTKNAYAAVLAQAKQKQDEQARQDSRKEASKAIFDADTLTTELAELLIDRVLVYPDKRIEIAYKIQDIFD